MKWSSRTWGAVRFAFRALVYEWRHGPGATLATPGSKPPPTLDELVSEIRTLLEERPEAPVQIEPVVPGPSVSAPVTLPVTSHPPLEVGSLSYYYVHTYEDGAAMAAYNGAQGGEDRQCLDCLRQEGPTFHAWMGGSPHAAAPS